jgi:hypothetical protein
VECQDINFSSPFNHLFDAKSGCLLRRKGKMLSLSRAELISLKI